MSWLHQDQIAGMIQKPVRGMRTFSFGEFIYLCVCWKMDSISPPMLYENEQYLIRPAKTTYEFKSVWWRFMQELEWNRGYYDLETYMNPSLGSGMLLLIDKSDEKPVGHVSAVINSNKTRWISMFIIDAAHRGKGMGRELFKAAMADAKTAGVEILGLDGVREQKATCEF